jgi:propanediol utilization protein
LIITEFELRANWHKTKAQVITVPPGSIITPTARDFLRSKGITVQIEGNEVVDFNKSTYSSAPEREFKENGLKKEEPPQQEQSPKEQLKKETPQNKPPQNKPEQMTHLRGMELIPKSHPVIALRGQNDLLQCEIIEAQLYFKEWGEGELVQSLDEILAFLRTLMIAEVKEKPLEFKGLLGLTPEELREQSHFPEKYFGLKHGYMQVSDGPVAARLHTLRSKVRVLELQAVRAFFTGEGDCTREDIILGLNRLSSAFFILTCRVRTQLKEKAADKTGLNVPIGISNRHVHLAQKDLDELFGKGYVLTPQKELSQPGQFAAAETVSLQGPKGTIEKVRVLGPVRKESQVEVSVTDCYKLGVFPLVRDSGQLEGTDGIRLIGPQGQVGLPRGVMVAGRHIHMTPEIAEQWGLKDGQRVTVEIPGVRAVRLESCLIRVSPHYQLEFHLDTDEGNAALITADSMGRIVGVQYG